MVPVFWATLYFQPLPDRLRCTLCFGQINTAPMIDYYYVILFICLIFCV